VNSTARIINQFFESVGSAMPFVWRPLINPHNVPKYASTVPPLHSPDYWQNLLKGLIARRVPEEKIEERVNLSNKEQATPRGLGPVLYVGAANPTTGEFQVFRSHKPDEHDKSDVKDESGKPLVFNRSPNDGISVEAVLASAAIPTLFKGVHTGKAVYWQGPQQRYPRPRVKEGAYWDGLYSSNPPIHELAKLYPDEIWVIQINPEEVGEEPKETENIEDRRNELAGNLSLNQELRFVRETNQLIRKHKIPQNPIKVRRIELTELTRTLNYFSKLDRDATFIESLMDRDGPEEAESFLEALGAVSPFEKAWEKALRDKQSNTDIENIIDDVMDLFADQAQIKLVPPEGSSASEQCYVGKEEGEKSMREAVRRCLKGNFNLEQARYYRVDGKETSCKEISWWMLASTGRFDFPVKGLAKVKLSDDGKIECFVFYPVAMKTVEELEKAREGINIGR
jgi:hypothetical protein